MGLVSAGLLQQGIPAAEPAPLGVSGPRCHQALLESTHPDSGQLGPASSCLGMSGGDVLPGFPPAGGFCLKAGGYARGFGASHASIGVLGFPLISRCASLIKQFHPLRIWDIT